MGYKYTIERFEYSDGCNGGWKPYYSTPSAIRAVIELIRAYGKHRYTRLVVQFTNAKIESENGGK